MRVLTDLCHCNVKDDISPPAIFSILDIDLQIEWQRAGDAWFAIVNSEAENDCPPNEETLLTECTVEDVEKYIIVGGADELMGKLTGISRLMITGLFPVGRRGRY